MKKRLAVLLGVLALSSFSFAAPTSVESSLNNLEAQLQKLEQMENAKFAQEQAKAEAAQARLDNLQKMDSVIDQRIADIEANVDTTIFNKEFKEKEAQYKSLKAEISKEIEKEQKVLENFELLKSLR
ncbi:adhesion protein FadA [Leptotrichia sp.]|jgi:hypothetical protein